MQKFINTAFLSPQFINMCSTVAFKDLLESTIVQQIKPACLVGWGPGLDPSYVQKPVDDKWVEVKMTVETPEVRSDKWKPREDRQNHRYHRSYRYHGYHRYRGSHRYHG